MKKLAKIFSIVIFIVFLAMEVVACTPQGLQAHSWSSDWSSNSNYHWRACMDAGCNGREDYGEHDWELTEVYEAATCGDTGLGQYTCTVCKATMGNKSTPATIPATGEHKYKLDTVDVSPKCGEDGYGSYICEVCYDYTVLPIPATGEHDFSGKYQSDEEGHYHLCLNGCGEKEDMQPHKAGEGIRFEPTGTKDGRIEYRCEVCDYLLDTEVIPNPNILHHFEVKFVRATNSSIVAIPELGDDGELYVTLAVSANAWSGYKLEYIGYTASGDIVDVTNVKLYYYNEFTGEKRILDLQHGGDATTGYLGYVENYGFYVSRATDDVSLWIESTPQGRDPVSLKVHIRTA